MSKIFKKILTGAALAALVYEGAVTPAEAGLFGFNCKNKCNQQECYDQYMKLSGSTREDDCNNNCKGDEYATLRAECATGRSRASAKKAQQTSNMGKAGFKKWMGG